MRCRMRDGPVPCVLVPEQIVTCWQRLGARTQSRQTAGLRHAGGPIGGVSGCIPSATVQPRM